MANPVDETNPEKKAKHLVKTVARFRNETIAMMRATARASNGRLLDPSQHSLKKKAKVASKLRKKGVAYEPRDLLRFTIVFSKEQYVRGAALAYSFLAQQKNLKTKAPWLKISWGKKDVYKGINTSWIVYTDNEVAGAPARSPTKALRRTSTKVGKSAPLRRTSSKVGKAKRETYTFELQFHTQDSLDLKETIHNAYDYVEYTCKAFPRDKSVQLAMDDGGTLATAEGIKKMEKRVAANVDSQSYRITHLIPQHIRRMMGSGTQIQKESCARVYEYMEQQAAGCPQPKGLTPAVAKMKLPALAAKFGGATRAVKRN